MLSFKRGLGLFRKQLPSTTIFLSHIPKPNAIKAKLLNAMTPKNGFTVHKNMFYGDDARHQLDVYIPKCSSHTTPTGLPVMLFIHGGAWNKGGKEDYVFLADAFTEAGFITVIANYRLAPAHVYPDYVVDTAQAIAWTHRHIADYGGDIARLFVMGHSSGAFNAVAAVNTPGFLEQVQLSKHAVKAVVGIAGPYSYDFRVDPTAYAFPVDGHPDNIMPNRLLGEKPVPHLLLTAQKDTLVEHFNTHDMATALQQQGAAVQVVEIQGANHVNVIAAFSRRLSLLADTKQVVMDYLAKFV